MIRRLLGSLSILVSTSMLVAGCSEDAVETATPPSIDSLVSAEWLIENADAPDLVIIDATVLVTMDAHGNFESSNGRPQFDEGHIPGAVFADLKGDLRDPDSPLEFGIPSPEQFAAAMSALGVSDDSRVVIYDNMGSSWAARVWWMLRWIGFDRAGLLDGGLNAWTAAGGESTTENSPVSPGELTINLRPQMIADQEEVRAAIADDNVELVDALPAAHYRGEMAMYDQPGHIPSARNIPVMSLFSDDGRFKSELELESLLEGEKSKRTITYCGGGIAASGNALALLRAGYSDVAIYAGSLEEWAANPENPMDVVLEFDEEY